MIPKTIHYCWFGRNPEPPLMQRCIASWQETMPDFTHKRWTEDNIPSLTSKYVQRALEAGQWANLSNYVRNLALFLEGGIYLDVDVEVLKSLKPLLHQQAFMGCETKDPRVNNAVMGAVPQHPFFVKMMTNLDEWFSGTEPANESSPVLTTELLKEAGLGAYQENPWMVDDILIFPTHTFYPEVIDGDVDALRGNTFTFTVHHWLASWRKILVADASKKQQQYKQKRKKETI